MAITVEYKGLELTFDGVPTDEQLEERYEARVRELQEESASQAGGIEHHEYGDAAPTSAEQRRLWFLQMARPESAAYVYPRALRLEGQLDREALRSALTRWVGRHEVLRTIIPQKDGEPYQSIQEPPETIEWELLDFRDEEAPEEAAREWIAARCDEAFDLATETPMRTAIIQVAEDVHVLLLLFHHIAIDRWSDAILLRELREYYEADIEGRSPELGELTIQYADYAIWQQEKIESEECEEGLAFWDEYLEGANEAIDWPMGREPVGDERPAETIRFEWSEETSERVDAFVSRSDTTEFLAWYSLFSNFLARYVGQWDLTIGVPVTTRQQRPEFQQLVGFFPNSIPMRTRLSPEETFEQTLERVEDRWQQTLPHQWIPFDEIVRRVQGDKRSDNMPLFDVLFTYAPDMEEITHGEFAGVAFEEFELGGQPDAKFALVGAITKENDRFQGEFEYNTARFDRADIERMIEGFEQFVAACMGAPEAPTARHPVIEPDHRRLLVDQWARGPEMERPDRSVPEMVEARAGEHPDDVALTFEGGEWTYGELDDRANRIAGALWEQGIRPGDAVGVSVERSPALVAALLGVNRAGAAYVALEPSLPESRLGYMLRDQDLDVVVADEAGSATLAAYRRRPEPDEVEARLVEAPGVERADLRIEQAWQRGKETLTGVIEPGGEVDLEEIEAAVGELADRYPSVTPREVVVGEAGEPVAADGGREVAERTIRLDEEESLEIAETAAGTETSRPLSPDQRRLWLVQQMEPSNAAYVVPEIASLEGDLEVDALREAARDVVDHYEVLRTTFPRREQGPVQVVHGVDEAFEWETVDVRDEADPRAVADERLEEMTGVPFDLAEDVPVRFALFRLSDRRSLFAAIFHHIGTDEWSSRPFWRRLEAAYRAGLAGESGLGEGPAVAFGQYAEWRRDQVDETEKRRQLQYWRGRLKGAPTGIDWPSEETPASGEAGPAGHVEFEWDEEVADKLEAWARGRGVSPFFGLYVAFVSYLAGYTGQSDLVVGVPATMRRQQPELDESIGFFLNPLPMRATLRAGESYGQLADRIWGDWRKALAAPEVSVDEIVDVLDSHGQTGATPLFDVLFTVVPEHGAPEGDFGGLEISPAGKQLPYMGVAQAKCALNVGVEITENGLAGSFIFDRERLEREAVETMVEQFGRFVEGILEEPETPLDAQFDEVLDTRPDDEFGDDTVLDKPTFLDPSAAMADGVGEAPEVVIDPESPIYVLYTSGTTGKPKGVMVPHRAVANHVRWLEEAYELGPSDVSMLKSSYGFDMSVSELFGPLTTGGTMAIAKPGGQKDPAYLVEAVRDFEVTCLRVVPTALNLMLSEEDVGQLESTLRWVMLGGEALSPAVRDEFFETFEDVELHNPFGITETCVDVTRWRCRRDRRGEPVSLGTPMGNYQSHVLDGFSQLVPPGRTGEICVGGAGVTHGYVNLPEKTAAAFVPDPHSDKPGARMYRSGDLARWDEQGELRYHGRKDDQLQVRGIRVELGEIEAHLESAPGVRQAAVRAVDETEGTAEALVGYVVPEVEAEPTPEDLREHLGGELREALIPGRYVELDEMPRNASGKIDRSELPEPDEAMRREERVAPRTETEETIAEIWKDHLEVDEIGVYENFFEIGGHSMLVLKIHAELKEAFAVEFPIEELIGRVTIDRIASYITEKESEQLSEDEFDELLAEVEGDGDLDL